MELPITRYFGENIFASCSDGISFLAKVVADSNGELDFQIRPDNWFNIYYKGNSLAKVKAQKNSYRIEIHHKFEVPEAVLRDALNRFDPKDFSQNGDYDAINITHDLMPKFFQKKILDALQSKIKEVNNGEEIAFEQSLMTDNMGRGNFIIIDRQVAGGGLTGILDLLALKRVPSGKYRFVVLEVKLGNNAELSSKVAGQLEKYVNAIKNNIDNFRTCYEMNYKQKKMLGLYAEDNFPDKISIDDEVEGRVVVGFYSKIGSQRIEKLLRQHPQLKDNVVTCWNRLEI